MVGSIMVVGIMLEELVEIEKGWLSGLLILSGYDSSADIQVRGLIQGVPATGEGDILHHFGFHRCFSTCQYNIFDYCAF